MTKPLVRIAHNLFAVSLIAFGIQQCIAGQILAGRPPAWPSVLPGQLTIAYVTGIWLILNGIAIISNKNLKSLIPTALFIFVFCASRNLYVVLYETDLGVSLTNLGKGIALASGLLMITVTSRNTFNDEQTYKQMDRFFVMICLYCFGFFLIASGIQHFLFADFVKFLVPSWIPFPLFWTYAGGVALAFIGSSLVTGIKRHLVAECGAAMIFVWVIILHIPRVIQDPSSMNEWTAVFEALAFSILLLIIGKSPVVASILNERHRIELVRSK